MDFEGMISCFEYGDETLELMQDFYDADASFDDLQNVLFAAKESELIPVEDIKDGLNEMIKDLDDKWNELYNLQLKTYVKEKLKKRKKK